jgi:pimeloyl-ACP methyl ester carboxylesterase
MDSLAEGSSFTSTDGMRVRFVREGHGPAVLLLHGSGSSLDAFDGIAARLCPTCEAIRLDLPGFGLSGPRPDRDYRIESYVAFLGRFLDGQSVENCTVVGNSHMVPFEDPHGTARLLAAFFQQTTGGRPT